MPPVEENGKQAVLVDHRAISRLSTAAYMANVRGLRWQGQVLQPEDGICPGGQYRQWLEVSLQPVLRANSARALPRLGIPTSTRLN